MKTESGIIYELGSDIAGVWTPFYVGETNDHKRRLGEHKSSAKTSPPKQKVYEYIQRQSQDFSWEMRQVGQYGPGSDDSEDEHIMKNLYDGVKLQNVKKGNPTWMAQRELEAADMRQRGVRSYKQYKKIITDEALAERQAKWMQERQAEEEIDELTRRRQEIIDAQIKRGAELSQERERQERIRRLKEKQAQEQRAADEEARRQRIKEETLRMQAEEQERQQAVLSMRELTGAANRDTEETLELKSQIKLLGGFLETITTMWNPNARHASTLEQHNQQIDYVSNRIKELTGELKLKTQEMERMNVRVKELSKQLEQNK